MPHPEIRFLLQVSNTAQKPVSIYPSLHITTGTVHYMDVRNLQYMNAAVQYYIKCENYRLFKGCFLAELKVLENFGPNS